MEKEKYLHLKQVAREVIGKGIPIGYNDDCLIIARILEKNNNDPDYAFSLMSHFLTLDEKNSEVVLTLENKEYYFTRSFKHSNRGTYFQKELVEKMFEYNVNVLSGKGETEKTYEELLEIVLSLSLYKKREEHKREFKKFINSQRLRNLYIKKNQ